MTDAGAPAATYRANVSACDALLGELRVASRRFTTARAVTFLASAGAFLVMDIAEGAVATAGAVTGALLVVVFVWEVAAHRRVRASVRWQETVRQLSVEGGLRLTRGWRALEELLPPAEVRWDPAPREHPYARDLDVLGEASLARLAGPVTSERGRAHLRAWLLAPASPTQVKRRQKGVAELASQVTLRHDFAAHGRLHAAADPPGTDRFLAWAEGESWLLFRRGIRTLAWILPVILVGTAVADLFFGAPAFWIFPALAQAEVMRRVFRRMNADMLMAEDGLALLTAYVPQIRLLEAAEAEAQAPILQDVAARLSGEGGHASGALGRLARLLTTVESRRNVVYVTLSVVFLVDIHLAVALDRWRSRWGADVRGWLEALGEWEALSALATLSHDNPDWTFPQVVDQGPAVLRGKGVGHPLLDPQACVCNDVEVGPPGTFLLVTGSNMSGKSTLLRALGANVVLAGAGGPVCAQELFLPPVRVRTSMRIDDSLAQGVSLFMAELLRIRGIVEDAYPVSPAPSGADGADGDASPPVLYLLDEILHGTNTAERRVAARAVVRHLLARHALGAVSTHDLTLAQAPDLEAAAQPVHFREAVDRVEGRTRLTFDYTLRPGLATTRNALKLLEAVGLGELVAGAEDEPEGRTP